MRHFMTMLALVSGVGHLGYALALAFGGVSTEAPEFIALSAGLAWLLVLYRHIHAMRARLAQLGVITIVAAMLVACGNSSQRNYRNFVCRDSYGQTTLFVSAYAANMRITPDGQQDWRIAARNWPMAYTTKPGEHCDFESTPQ